MTFLFEQVIPELKERGMTDDQLNQMMVGEPETLASLGRPRAWCNGCTRAFQALSTGSIPVARFSHRAKSHVLHAVRVTKRVTRESKQGSKGRGARP
jgi:hypothetical protein